ncbi:hypothetical protein TorRG33x02_321480 [Trema orientale]|uniref:Uncharacterized protein n=1 Tax=Trema orientale TaxID=63057 RepID=A0A2P5BH22_TREOI|nr:hypothetical protein TorRG33x02_321480 [Trema orientale]
MEAENEEGCTGSFQIWCGSHRGSCRTRGVMLGQRFVGVVDDVSRRHRGVVAVVRFPEGTASFEATNRINGG